jgi:CRP-like cAMP-binding protein
MKSIYDELRAQDFFKDMSEDMLNYLAGCGQNMHFSPNHYIGKENDAADYLYLIKNGRISVEVVHPIRGPINIRTLHSGEMAGFSWIIPPYRLQFGLKALDHTSVVALDGTCMRAKCEEDHHLGYLLMKQSAVIMNKRLRDTRMQLLDVYRE